MMERVAVITGANAGIGLVLARRLLREHSGPASGTGIKLCLACRNLEKAEVARGSLLAEYPEAQVELLQVDTSSPRSAIAAAREIQHRYRHVDWLFCNAGIMPISGVNWGALWPPSPSNLYFNFSTGGNLLRTEDGSTPEGLRKVFATNVLGHYLMIQQLEDFLASQGRPCHIIWTSSSSARRATFDPSDLQGEKSNDSYASSKKLIDLISREMNSNLNAKGIYSHTTCPGLVMTQLTYGILPKWCWALLFPILVLIRLLMTHFMTVDPYNGSEVLVWLSRQEPASLDHSLKYYSRTNALGKAYVMKEKIPGSEELSKDALAQLQQFSERFTTESPPAED